MVSQGDKTAKILERVRLLLARADNNPHKEEAELCRERAERLIIQHGITSLEEEGNSNVMRITIELTGYANACMPKMNLLSMIGQIFGCQTVRTGKRNCYIAGQESALDVTWELFQLLEAQLDEQLFSPDRVSPVGQFAYGWVLRVGERVREMYRQEVEEVASSGHDLVLANKMSAVEEYLSNHGVSKSTRRRKVSVSAEGTYHGDRADIGIDSRKVNDNNTRAIGA